LRTGDFSVTRGKTATASELGPSVKWVDREYPNDIGLIAKLENQGHQVGWCSDDQLARRLDIEGWLLVYHETESGQRVVLKAKDPPYNLNLIMKPKAAE
jgi:hypothetical protein